MIIRDQPKVIWKKSFLKLSQDDDKNLSIVNERQPFGVGMTEDEYLEMIQESAEYLGKKITIEDAPILCPSCGSETAIDRQVEEVVDKWNDKMRVRHRRYCEVCGLSGPRCSGKELADKEFERITFLPEFKLITVEEETARR